jgi:hypothetical protein
MTLLHRVRISPPLATMTMDVVLVVHLVLTLSSIDDGDDDGTIPLSPSTVMDWFSFLSLSDPLSPGLCGG